MIGSYSFVDILLGILVLAAVVLPLRYAMQHNKRIKGLHEGITTQCHGVAAPPEDAVCLFSGEGGDICVKGDELFFSLGLLDDDAAAVTRYASAQFLCVNLKEVAGCEWITTQDFNSVCLYLTGTKLQVYITPARNENGQAAFEAVKAEVDRVSASSSSAA